MIQLASVEAVAKIAMINKKKAAIARKAGGNAGHKFWERNPWKDTTVTVGETAAI